MNAPAHTARRRLLAAGFCLGWLGGLLSRAALAQEFNRAAELKRYRAWFQAFTQDIERLSAARRPLSDAQLDALFARTVVPGSRAAAFIRGTFTQRGDDGTYVARYGPRRVFMGVLQNAIPAGQGGVYPEIDPALKGPELTVWYMHVDAGDMANTYLKSPENFTPYRLPPAGTLERKAYPFLLMESRDGTLRLGGVSSELWGLIVHLHNAAL